MNTVDGACSAAVFAFDGQETCCPNPTHIVSYLFLSCHPSYSVRLIPFSLNRR